MSERKYVICTGNQAVAHIAYKINEVCPIYPITPSSDMSELIESWSAEEHKNIFGSVPTVMQMQSEAGVAGAMHGALQTGALATTFTASQGLLLMLPNMYKIAGELTPNVIHVATRTLATHALSIHSDHSDVMAVRNSGYALLAAASVQEAMDFALISQAASLKSRIPFVHFFDGFTTSHETAKIEWVDDICIKGMMDKTRILNHKKRALNPDHPVIRGTAQTADVFFQSREAANGHYRDCPNLVQLEMNNFAKLTGRQYKIFDYVGHPEAEQVLVAMASGTATIEETIKHLNSQGERIGLVKVRLYRPFSKKHLLAALPVTCKSVAVLDKTKEPGASGEPLYLDVVQSLMETLNENTFHQFPKIVGGRYGLSSKEFSPAMVMAVIKNLKRAKPINNFTVGIKDDVNHLSLEILPDLYISKGLEAIIYEKNTDDNKDSFNNVLKLLGYQKDQWVQGTISTDYNKLDNRQMAALRVSASPITAPYQINTADYMGCDELQALNSEINLNQLKDQGILLVATSCSQSTFLKKLNDRVLKTLINKKIRLYLFDKHTLSDTAIIESYKIEGLYLYFLHLCNLIDRYEYSFKSPPALEYVATQQLIDGKLALDDNPGYKEPYMDFPVIDRFTSGQGDLVPVSAFPVDGTFPTGVEMTKLKTDGSALPDWNENLCNQCGACSMACPQGALRIKVFKDEDADPIPEHFKQAKTFNGLKQQFPNYSIQMNPDQCTGCQQCVDACAINALTMQDKSDRLGEEKTNWDYFETLPEVDRSLINTLNIGEQQLQEPLFKYPKTVVGCGQSPYIKLLSQLFGDRLLIANATGESSIFGGAIPAIPWSKDRNGRGPAWSNSLFEDNAEFGLGFKLSLEHQMNYAKSLLPELMGVLGFDLINALITNPQNSENAIERQRRLVVKLKSKLKNVMLPVALNLLSLADSLVQKSVWIIGGDGWANDIGYGGLDHVLASGRNVNILVLDNEMYGNTGGQKSKSTPFGAKTKFASQGNNKHKKDLGLMAMGYEDVYVASVAMGADQHHVLKSFQEAESFDGPSIVIAYCHSPAHGINIESPSQYHRAAVNSGQWLLYRNDPRREENGLNPFQLDSKNPSIKVDEYLYMEKRFTGLFEQNSINFKEMVIRLQQRIDKRFQQYLARATAQI